MLLRDHASHRHVPFIPIVITLSALAVLAHPAATAPTPPPAVTGGDAAAPGAWPWMAALVYAPEPNAYHGRYCGAVLVHPHWVLTAAHCVSADPTNVDVVVGRTTLSDNAQGERIPAAEIVPYPFYNPTTIDGDVALVRLAWPAAQPPLPLATAADAARFAPGVTATVLGWGDTGAPLSPDTLQQATLPIVDTAVCNQPASYDGAVTGNMLCAGQAAGGVGACPGDSGGPLVVSDGASGHLLVGTVSWGDGCGAPEKYSVFARTPSFATWLATTLATTPSTVDWVGEMYPAGGTSTERVVGDLSGLVVYVQVFKSGVTEPPGQGAGLECFLHWGAFGLPWADAPMSYNVDIGNNDEYWVTLPTGGLAPDSYGFTAYCTDDGGVTKRWRDASDGGDGLLSVTPLPAPPPGTAFVHLFEWRWDDIAQECPFLAEKGYTAVQVSPPMEHVIPFAPDYPWWVRYQPVSYELATSRSGTLVDFQAMVTTCKAAGVDIYVDAVVNHMTTVGSGSGTNGTSYTPYDYPGVYSAADFHYCGTPGHDINDFADRFQVQTCELLSLADLDTGAPYVQTTIRAYLQSLLDLGVAGFRVDAAKHIAAHELAAILGGLNGDFYVFQEVIEGFGEPVRAFEYTIDGDVTEFGYSRALADAFTDDTGAGCPGPDLAALNGLETTLLASGHAVVFVDNHDNQRGHGAGGPCVVDHRDGDALYNLANIFMLAYPYGYPKVMSSYHWDGVNDDAGPPGAAGVTSAVYSGGLPVGCNATDWVCEHRRPAIANMVEFRRMTDGQPVTGWWDNGLDQIAFGRDGAGYVALNRAVAGLSRTFATGMPAGTYCDIAQGELTAAGTGCTGRSIAVNGASEATVMLNALDAFAIHTASLVGGCATQAPTAVALSAAFNVADVQLTWPDDPANASYALYRATTPYFTPDGLTEIAALPGGTTAYTDTIEAHAPAYYVLRSLNCSGGQTAVSGEVGVFPFALKPGA